MKGKNPLGTQWSLEPSCPINLGIQPSSCPRILQTCTRTEKTQLVPRNLSVKSIYAPENISITQSCARKRSITCIVQFGGSKDAAVSSKPSPNLQLSWRSAGRGRRVASNSPWHRKAPGALGRQAPTPVDWAKWWEMDEINGQVDYSSRVKLTHVHPIHS